MPFVITRIIQQEGKLMEEPRIELIVKSSGEQNSSERRLEHRRSNIFRSIRVVRSFGPTANGKDDPRQQRAGKKSMAERLADENFFRKEAEIDGPSVSEDARQLKGLGEVLNWIRHQERSAQSDLDEGADGEERNPVGNGELHDHDAEQAGSHEKNVHLDRDGEREPCAAEVPTLLHEVVDGDVGEEHREAVVEATKHEDGVDALGEEQEHRETLRKTAQAEDFHDEVGRGEINEDEDALREKDVFSVVSDVVKGRVQVDETGRIDERPCVTLEFCVIHFSVEKSLHFLHVGDPVNFCVRNEPDDETAKNEVDGQKAIHEGSRSASDRVDGRFIVQIRNARS